ncbi:hypothetical protein LP415_05615 [Polaromonas sp. P1(28)-8]|nr:hypothetical protein LP415_05615 [Polaromonas sp. P1(28)-8]
MSKIVQAVNAMISNPDKIGKVIRGESEFFFLYKDKYKWSMSPREGDHILWFYPGDESLEQLASYEGQDWEDTSMVTYRDSEIGTKEAKASFAELYTLLKERVYGVNKVLDDIISDAEPF